MAGDAGLTAQISMYIFFADPHPPWERGSNENTNGLLRRYLLKGRSLSDCTTTTSTPSPSTSMTGPKRRSTTPPQTKPSTA
jgi:IS30 family transposase